MIDWGINLKEIIMQNFIRNWKTSLFGLLAGVAQIGMAASQASAAGTGWHQADYITAGIGVLMALGGAAAKDGNVTGVSP